MHAGLFQSSSPAPFLQTPNLVSCQGKQKKLPWPLVVGSSLIDVTQHMVISV